MVDGCVVRQEKAYPVYDEDYRANVAMIRHELEVELPDAAPGRPQRHAPLQQPGPRDDDRDAHGENILAGERVYDTWGVNEDAEYHEAGSSGVKSALGSERLVPQRAPLAANSR